MGDRFLDELVNDLNETNLNWAKAMRLLRAIVGEVKQDEAGDFYIARNNGGMHYMPEAMNDALKEASAYLDTVK